ncbi:MAG: hypothetical protein KKD44_04225 [Proteobacteria bacterium]|nr:hypothetical protein [Pseudomonadota bacterium]
MFWKKKTSDKSLLEYDNDNRRMSFRLDSDDENPLFAKYGDHLVRMRNISAGGVSFDYDKGQIGDKHPICITLPGPKGISFSGSAEILTLSNEITCHCSLSHISEEIRESIHQYILYAQINQQREKRLTKDLCTGN